MTINENDIIDFYQKYDEDNRMLRKPLEYMRCKEIISRYLMNATMDILDIGGGTGAFSFWLSEQGHRVCLIDFVPKHINIAKRHEIEKKTQLVSADVGDARKLPFNDGSFDLVLLMGPLYHLTDRDDRMQAIREAYRVLKAGGILVGEVISRFASLIDGFNGELINDSEFIPIMREDIRTGHHIDTSTSKNYFTNTYFHHPDELPKEIGEAGFIFEKQIAVTSFGFTIPNIESKLRDVEFQHILLDTIRAVECEKSLMGISSHFIGIGRKL
jgi:ubiquinone/menaquinone biosynthesis C-methylase UbiE